MMTLDEAIKHCEEVAEKVENDCIECAKDHEQLAGWLTELKQLREQEPCDDCISRQAVFELIDFYDGQNQQHFTVDNLRDDVENVLPVIPKGVTVTDFADKCRECGREKVLDKIRAEIAIPTNSSTIKDYDEGWEDAIKRDLRIIDKYKVESEQYVPDTNVGNINCILNKIRHEIESCREDEEPHLVDYRYYRNEGLDMALNIIDNYKTESEDEE